MIMIMTLMMLMIMIMATIIMTVLCDDHNDYDSDIMLVSAVDDQYDGESRW